MSQEKTLTQIALALGVSKRTAERRAEREGWTYTGATVRGGIRRLYDVRQLPAEIREKLLEHAVIKAAEHTPAPEIEQRPVPQKREDLTDTQRLERDARAGVLAALRRIQSSGCSQEAALTALVTNARTGLLDDATTRMLRLARDPRGRVGDGIPSTRTLKRWLSRQDDLAPRAPRPDMSIPDWAGAFLAAYRRPEKPSVQQAYQNAAWPSGIEQPSIHQVRRLLAKMGTVSREAGRMGPRELKNLQPFVRRDFSHLEPCDVWSADGHTFDAEVQHPLHGRPFRPEITVFVDIATRAAVGWSVDLAESASAVADALRTGVERYGVPAIIYVDNGSGYRNAFMSDAALGLVGRIGATMEHSLPYNSQARGVIERLHQTLWVDGAKELPGYIGAAMDRQARLEQFALSRRALKKGGTMPLLPWELFVEWVTQRVDWYNQRPHRSLGGTSPALAWAAFEKRGWAPTRVDADVLDTLFRPRVSRTVARGELVLFNNRYFSRELEEFHGHELHVAYDIHNAGTVWVYWPDGRLICTAEVDGNRRHYFPVPVVQQAREKRAQGRLNRVDAKRDEILAELNGTTALPAPAQGSAVIGGRIITPADVQVAQTRAAELIAPAPQPQPARGRSERSAAENHAEWLALKNAQESGTTLTEQDARFVQNWPNTSQGRGFFRRAG